MIPQEPDVNDPFLIDTLGLFTSNISGKTEQKVLIFVKLIHVKWDDGDKIVEFRPIFPLFVKNSKYSHIGA